MKTQKQQLTAWGRFPVVESERVLFSHYDELADGVSSSSELIAFGNGRSYGDSALSSVVAPMLCSNRFLGFDEASGVLTCEAGVLLSDIIKVFLPRGWFLKVTPGTKLITVGGAIACDIHGKNHHVEGCFSECVESFRMMLADGSVVECSRSENRELFLATCGGMGLTGIILQATLALKPVKSQNIRQTTIKTRNLKDTFEAFEAYSGQPYSVAWIDCLAKGKSLGRSILMVGDFADDGDINYVEKRSLSVPLDFPTFALNTLSVKAFNMLYYGKAKMGESQQTVGVDSFFYPLDALNNWNRIYGKAGFTQYQFILPKSVSYEGLSEILSAIAASGRGSFLAVLKLYGPANENYLSFPLEGYSLALDFKIEKGLFPLLDRLDSIVVRHGGRIYLTKDVRVSRETFEAGYPELGKFMSVRQSVDPKRKFASLQSKRLGL